MRINTLLVIFICFFISGRSIAQTDKTEATKYHKFAVYAGVGPSYFFNNLVAFKNDVNPLNYAFSARVMWEPEHSFLSLGIETGYFRLYSANSVVTSNNVTSSVHVTNSSIPIQFVISMKFSNKFYGNWAMGQSVTLNNVTTSGVEGDHDASTWSLADFSATAGYRFIQKSRISYAAEIKGFYSSSYRNSTIAILFIAGYRF